MNSASRLSNRSPSRFRASAVVAVGALCILSLSVRAADSTAVRLRVAGLTNEATTDGTNRMLVLEWTAVSNATYRIQGGNFGDTPGLNGGDMVWKTIDVVTPQTSAATYRVESR